MTDFDNGKLEHQKDSKNTPIVASFIVFIESGATYIQNPLIKNLVTIGAPIFTYILVIIFNSLIHSIESKRGIKVIEDIIKDVERQRASCTDSKIESELDQELLKLRADRTQAKKEAIKIVVY